MTRDKPTVLVVVRRPPLAPEAIAVADALDRDGRYRPVVATERAGLEFIPPTELTRFEFVGYDGAAMKATAKPAAPPIAGKSGSPLKTGARDFVLRTSAKVPLAAFALSVRTHRIALAQVRSLLDRVSPAAVVVFDDRAPGHPMLLVHEALTRGIPSIFLPFAASTVESDLMLRSHKLQHQVDNGPDRYIKRSFASAFPHHVHQTLEGRFLFFPWPTVAALRAFGLHGTRPWVMGGGETTVVGLFSESEREELLATGIEASRIRLIGQPTTDALFRVDRHKLREELGVEQGRTIIICAIPQTAEHGMTDWKDHRRTSEELFRALTDTSAAVLLSLHPKSKPQTYQAAADAAGARIVMRPLAEILPAADVFVANFSSTVRWAAALGIPTVIADLSRFRYTMYDMLASIPKVESVPEVAEHMRRLVSDETFRHETASTLRREASVYSTLDGRVGERLLATLDELTGRHGADRPGAQLDLISQGGSR